MLKMFDALPAYFGGKRKLAKKILMYAEGKTFIDGFMGGGSVSLLAKARGFRVMANDIADRSAVVGQALIVNDDVMIEPDDIVMLFKPAQDNKHYIRDHQAKFFMPEITEFLDNARANIERVNDPLKKAVLMLLWIKVIFHYRPMSGFGHVGAVAKIESQEIDTPVLEHLQECYSRPIYKTVEKIAEDVNAGVFANGVENEFHCRDVFEFLANVEGDTVYLDPPYFGTESYERHYNALDSMLAGHEVPLVHSIFNTRQVISNTLKLFESCQEIPVWIFSIGQRVVDKKKYIELMSDFRKVEDIPVRQSHSYGFGSNENAGDQEVLLVGRPK